jgi:ABC-type dipeptide/oligopeptide/nickel transport system permease component
VALYLTRRLLTLIPAWIGVTLLAFLFVHSIPGGPFDTGAVRPQATTALLKSHYHLDRSLPIQYALYMKNVLTGDLGESIVQPGLRVSTVLSQRFPTSAELGCAALLVALGLGVPAGLLAATKRNRLIDRVVMVGATIGYAIPNFILSILFILVVGLYLHLLPLGGWGRPSQVVLPALALGLPWASFVARLTRGTVIGTLQQDYIRTARAKGAGPARVLVRHAFRNALMPITTVTALLIAELITGSLVIESIFSIPGMGQYLTNSVLGSDYTMTLGLIIFYATLLFAANVAVDLLYVWLDPRVRY